MWFSKYSVLRYSINFTITVRNTDKQTHKLCGLYKRRITVVKTFGTIADRSTFSCSFTKVVVEYILRLISIFVDFRIYSDKHTERVTMKRRIDPDVRLCAEYEYKLRHSVKVALDNLLRAYGANAVSLRTVEAWFREFRCSDEKRNRTAVDPVELKRMIDENPRIRLHELARYFGVPYGTIQQHTNSIVNGGICKPWRMQHFEKRKRTTRTRKNGVERLDELLEMNRIGSLDTEAIINSTTEDDADFITYL
ncbi:hypothetical protein GCK32_008571 [Trichostrongylus colubriformis]|uniref:Mos1 transposase HTH domain-containing protein n=1 Tax=Trichostrongylus colubriformis TaxID=6319 RepID=A0AAN8FDC5_TRICO